MNNQFDQDINQLIAEIERLKKELTNITSTDVNPNYPFPLQLLPALENAQTLLLHWDYQNNILVWSEHAERTLGFPAKSFGDTLEEYLQWIHPEDREMFQSNLEEKFQKFETFCNSEYRMVREDDSILWIKTSAQILYDKTKRPNQILGILINNTNYKSTETELKEHSERLELISRGIYDAIWDWNIPNKTNYYSNRWKELRGYSENEIGESEEEWSKGIHPEDKERVFAAIQNHFKGNTKFFEEEYRVLCKDGSYKWILDHGIAQKDRNGNVVRMLGSESDITQKKLAEERLQEQSKFLTLILNHLPNQIYWKDKNLFYQGCNQQFAEVVGLEAPEQIIGLTDFDFARSTEFAEKYRSEDRLVMEKQKPIFNVEEPFHNTKGEKGWVSTSKIPLYRKNKLFGIIGISTDITKKKKAEVELKINSQRYEALFNNSPVPLWEEDFSELFQFLKELKANKVSDFRLHFDQHPEDLALCSQKVKVTNVNKATLELHQARSKEELIGNLDKIFTQRSFEVFKEEVICIANGENSFETEGEIKTLNGIPRQILLKLTINYEADNYKALVATLDITDKKQADKALEESEEKFRSSFEASDVGMAIVGNDTQFKSVNPAFCKMLEADQESFLQQNFISITYPDDIERSKEKYQQNIANRKSFTIEKRYLTKSGNLRWGLTTVSPIFDYKGELLYSIVHVQDITDRKISEEELVKSNREFESLNEEYKSQNEELVKAIEVAERSDRLKTEFLQNLSHEIRTPMNAILGFSDFLDMENISPNKRKQYINIIKNSGNQLLRIIDDILEISALETKHVQLVESTFCLNSLLTELFTIFQPQANKQNLSLYLHKERKDKESMIRSDEIKLKKVLMNLIENSLKYTNKGSVEIGYHSNSNQVELYVKDTGVGISPERHESIFERFSQAEGDITKKTRGLGLGLSIVKENVHLLGGEIQLESNPGKGSKFTVLLPDCLIEIPVKKVQASISKHKILLAEDEEINYFYFKTVMEEVAPECNLIHAKNGIEAVELCKTNDFDLVFMDIKMPEMNGYEATFEIKKIKPNLDIIAQTAYTTEEDQIRADQAGCCDFISKPISLQTIQDILQRFSII